MLFNGCGDDTHQFEFLSTRGHPFILDMATPDLTQEDYSDLAALVRDAIDAELYRAGPRIKRLRLLLGKLEPEREKSAIIPPPMPSAQPSLLYQKLRGGRRRR